MALVNDTTLRDGEQAPYVAFNTEEKLAIAEQEDIKELLALGLDARMMTWNRARMEDLEASLECGIKAVDLSIPVSDILIDVKFGGDRERMLRELSRVVEAAKREGVFVCIGAEDSSRGSLEFITEVMKLGSELGADRFRASSLR